MTYVILRLQNVTSRNFRARALRALAMVAHRASPAELRLLTRGSLRGLRPHSSLSSRVPRCAGFARTARSPAACLAARASPAQLAFCPRASRARHPGPSPPLPGPTALRGCIHSTTYALQILLPRLLTITTTPLSFLHTSHPTSTALPRPHHTATFLSLFSFTHFKLCLSTTSYNAAHIHSCQSPSSYRLNSSSKYIVAVASLCC